MAARILNGADLANQIKAEVAEQVKRLAAEGIRPGLAAVLVGDDPASEVYVRNKVKSCEALGLHGETIVRPSSSTTADLLKIVHDLNAREEIDGILVQLPLPAQVDTRAVLLAMSSDKDVDGFHPMSVGRLSTKMPALVPCTPAGVMELLRRNNVPLEGAEAVMVGRSNIVGKPMAMLLTNANATVTLCHSKTRDLASVTRRADLLVVAVGKPGLITRAHVKPGATVVDIGINRISDRGVFDRYFRGDAKRESAFAKNGYVIMGDVEPDVAEIAGAITPVPGGVGPLTIAMLMVNTVTAATQRRRAPAMAERG